MRKAVMIVVVAAVAAGGFALYKRSGDDPADVGGQGQGGGRGGQGGRMGMVRPPMPVEFTTVRRAPVAERVLVVGNLIGAATVQVVPRINGRLQAVNVKLGDPVRRGQSIAKVEDGDIQEQVRQAQAAHEVARATIRQREADLTLAKRTSSGTRTSSTGSCCRGRRTTTPRRGIRPRRRSSISRRRSSSRRRRASRS